jgi:hypothetical protein
MRRARDSGGSGETLIRHFRSTNRDDDSVRFPTEALFARSNVENAPGFVTEHRRSRRQWVIGLYEHRGGDKKIEI